MASRSKPDGGALIDTSVVIASLDADEPHHVACDRVLASGDHFIYLHALAETFSILTGGRQGRRLRPAAATDLIKQSVLPFVKLIALNSKELLAGLAAAETRGARGGAVYDLLHLMAARKAGVGRLLTLDIRNFEALVRTGDPRIECP